MKNATTVDNFIFKVLPLFFSEFTVHTVGPQERRGYSDSFIYTYAWPIFGVQHFEFQYFGGFQYNEFFRGLEDCMDIFGGHKTGLSLVAFLCILGSFLRSRYRTEIFLGVAEISNMF